MKVYRQGDLLLVELERPHPMDHPSQEIGWQRVVIGRGERTGHEHVLLGLGLRYRRDDGVPQALPHLIEAPLGMLLSHPEHVAITFPPGTYEVHHQRQYLGGVSEEGGGD